MADIPNMQLNVDYEQIDYVDREWMVDARAFDIIAAMKCLTAEEAAEFAKQVKMMSDVIKRRKEC